jgi:hypothetical protein
MNQDYPITSGAGGILYGDAVIPTSPPLSYIPCRGEYGISDGARFFPIDQLSNDQTYDYPGRLMADDVPVVAMPMAIPDTEVIPPNEQYDRNRIPVRIPAVRPYNWTAATTDRRVMVLDTTPDATATDEEKAEPGYIPNPGITLLSKTHEEFDLAAFDDVNGVAYRWTFEPAEIVFKFRRTSPVSGWWTLETPDGTGTILFNAAGGTPTTTYIAGGYEITAQATIKFKLNGGTERAVSVQFTTGFAPSDFDSHFVNGNQTKPITPHPGLRSGSSMYVFSPSDATPTVDKGTVFEGTPFLPMINPVNGVIRACAYHYGMLLGYAFGDNAVWGSAGTSVPIRFKIGKATETWVKSTKLLTFATPTPDAKIYYSLDGSAPTVEHAEPIYLEATTAVRWIVRKPCMEDSDEFLTAITFVEGEAPDDFASPKFSTLPAYSNSPIDAALLFQTKADWYVTPDGSGDGKTPQTPGSASAILGIYGSTQGSALGRRNIYAQANASGSVAFSHDYYAQTGVSVMFTTSAGITGFSAYTAPINSLDAPGKIYLRLARSAGTQILTDNFEQRDFSGSANVRAVWDATSKTLALSLTATPTAAGSVDAGTEYTILRPGNTDWTAIGAGDNNAGTRFEATGAGSGTGEAVADLYGAGRESLYYAANGTDTPAMLYSAPILVDAPTVFAFRAFHTRTDFPNDFNTATAKVTLASIDPDATASYDTDNAVAFSRPASDSLRHTKRADVVWISEGTWDVSDSVNRYGKNLNDVRILGGFNAEFSERDVKNRTTKFKFVDNTSGLVLGNINGITFDAQEFTPGFTGGVLVNAVSAFFCTFSYGRNGVATAHGFLAAGRCCYCNFLFDGTAGPTSGNRMIFCAGGVFGHGTKILVRAHKDSTCAYMDGMSFGHDCDIDIEIVARDQVAGEALRVLDRSRVRFCGYHSGYLSPLTVDFGNDCDIEVSWRNGLYYPNSPAVILQSTGQRNTIAVDSAEVDAKYAGTPGYQSNYGNNIRFSFWREQDSCDLVADNVAQGISPTRMTGDELTITEAVGTYEGNMKRVNGSVGWYSGTPNGDGAPLAGYETPQGTGIALGRYWE